MTSSAPRRLVLAGLAMVTLQTIAVIAYRQVESSRKADAGDSFRYEVLGGSPPLPTVELVRADGTTLSSRELKGGPVLLHFWATSCPPCREELPGLLALGQDQPGLRVVAIAADDDWAPVGQFFGGKIPSAVVRDPGGSLAKRYEVGALPDTYLLDAGGAARVRFNGARDWGAPQARDLVAQERWRL